MKHLFSAIVITCLALSMCSGDPSVRCAMCTKKFKASSKTAYTVTKSDAKLMKCCCGHCGLMIQVRLHGSVKSATTKDYVSGDEVDATKAVYVIASGERPCCCPSAVAFEDRAEAERLCKAKGGVVLGFADACDVFSGKRKLPGIRI